MMDAIYGCDTCRTTIGRAGCPTHRGNAQYVAPSLSWTSSQPVLTHCEHGLDLRIHPRCYLCNPAHEHGWSMGGNLTAAAPAPLDEPWDPHAVDEDHPCGVCGKTVPHGHWATPAPLDAPDRGEVVTGRRLFDLKDEADHDWLAGYFSGYHAVPMHLNDKKVLVARCGVLQSKVTAHHRHDHVTAKTCEVCPDD